MNELNNNKDDNLTRVVEVFVDMYVPEGPADDVKQSLLAQLTDENSGSLTTSVSPKKGPIAMRRFTSLAAAVLAMVAIGWILVQLNTNPTRAFAAMVDHFQTIRTATFTMTFALQGADITGKSELLEPAWVRQETQFNGNEMVQIMDLRQGKVLSLLAKTKTAMLVEISGTTDQERQRHVIDEFRKMTSDSATYVGREMVDEISALKYTIDRQGDYYTVWLDPESDLPVKVEMTDVAESDEANSRLTMTDFVWNAKIDESAFTFDIPDGYELTKQAMDLGDSDVDHFVKMMRFVVRLNDDKFLEEFNMMALVSTIQKQLMKREGTKEEREKSAKEKLAYALDRPEVVDMSMKERMEFGMELQQSFGQGAIFHERLVETHHWRYQGKGVKLGEADKIVAWWYPKKDKAEDGADIDTAQVLYGDLRIETMPVDELPNRDDHPSE